MATLPPTAATGIELRGILTLLGRPQVLLNFCVPGKTSRTSQGPFLVMDVNQREGEVEVLRSILLLARSASGIRAMRFP